jgi:pilus assembly protein TadC
MLPIIFLLIFGSVSLVAWQLLLPREDVVGRRLGVSGTTTQTAPRTPLPQRMARGLVRKLGRVAARLLPQNFVREIDVLLVKANEPWPLVGFLGAWAAFVVMGILLVLWFATSIEGITVVRLFVLAFAILPIFGLLPFMILRRRALNRQRAIIRSLPDALDLLVTCVEAGMGIDAAIALVVEKTEGPLSETFSQYLKEVGLGLSRRAALTRLSERTGVPQLMGLAAAINQGEELGTPLADVLRLQSEDLRADRRERAQTAAQRAPVLMTIPLVLCFMPAMGAVVVVPSILNLMDFVQGIN